MGGRGGVEWVVEWRLEGGLSGGRGLSGRRKKRSDREKNRVLGEE